MIERRTALSAVLPSVERRRGRPANAVPSGAVCTWLTAPEQDRLIQIAKAQRTSVSEVIRVALQESVLAS